MLHGAAASLESVVASSTEEPSLSDDELLWETTRVQSTLSSTEVPATPVIFPELGTDLSLRQLHAGDVPGLRGSSLLTEPRRDLLSETSGAVSGVVAENTRAEGEGEAAQETPVEDQRWRFNDMLQRLAKDLEDHSGTSEGD